MDEQLESFYFKETINGVEHDFRVTMAEHTYEVERDGKLVAELQHNEVWVQLSGEPLSEEVKDAICDKIESHFC